MKNNGLQNEINIINYINKYKYINNMNENMKNFLTSIFNFDLSDYEIEAKKYISNYKPDITITANGITKYISIKCGNDNSIHHEHIYSFLNYLNELGVEPEVITYIRFFHFNDGTINGSGNQRNSATHFLSINKSIVKVINNSLNKIKKDLLNRILFTGEYYNLPQVDYIYYGNENKGYWANKQEIIDFLSNSYINSESIHISKIYYQSYHRNLKFNKIYEYRRYYAQFKWHSICKDLEYITKKRNK